MTKDNILATVKDKYNLTNQQLADRLELRFHGNTNLPAILEAAEMSSNGLSYFQIALLSKPVVRPQNIGQKIKFFRDKVTPILKQMLEVMQ